MANILRSPIWPDPRVKPPFGAVPLNRDHRLAPTCAALCNNGGPYVYDLGLGLTLAPTTATTIQAPSKAGLGLQCKNNNDGVSCAAPAILQPATTTTIMWRGVILGSRTAEANGSIVTYTNADNAPYTAYGINLNPGGGTYWGANWNNGTIRSLFSNRGALVAGTLYTFVFTIDGTTATIYTNGVKDTSTTSNIGTISYANAKWCIGEYRASSRNPNALTDVTYIWPGRTLSAGDILQLHAEPYAMFEPVIRRRHFVPSVVAGNVLLNPDLSGGFHINLAGGFRG